MANDQALLQLDLAKLYTLFAPALGRGGNSGQPDPDHPLKPGPWDPVTRIAAKEILRFGTSSETWRYGPQPEPWTTAVLGNALLALITRHLPALRDVIGEVRRAGEEASLNPQPLPPLEAFTIALAEALVTRVELLADVAGAFTDARTSGAERAAVLVGGHVGRLIDDYCGNGFRLVWPFPGPPPWWFKAEVGARELLMLGAHLNAASDRAFDPVVQGTLAAASAKLAKAAVERLG